jgi:hypothetical protein
METKRSHRGRPTKPPKHGKKSTLSIRATADLKKRLDRAAKESDRPFSQEAEIRLERSFERQDLISDVLDLTYGQRVADFLIAIGALMSKTGRHAGFISSRTLAGADNWLDDPWAYEQAAQAVQQLLDKLRPPGEIKAPNASPQEVVGGPAPMELSDIYANLGVSFANGLIYEIANKEHEPAILGEHAERLRRGLGERLRKKGRSQ